MCIAVCPGSYDPVTNGHLDIIRRCSRLFEHVIVVVTVNREKSVSFTKQERVEMLREITAGLPNVSIDMHDGLITEYAQAHNVSVLVRGLRAMTDFEYEFQMALINKKLNPHLETMFINTDAKYMYLSSSMVREVASFGRSLAGFVPPGLEERIVGRLSKKDAGLSRPPLAAE